MGRSLIALAGAALVAAGAAVAQPAPPARPHGLAPETPLKDAAPLREGPHKGGPEAAKDQDGKARKPAGTGRAGAQTDAPPTPPPRPDDIDRRPPEPADPGPTPAAAPTASVASPGDACLVELAALGVEAPKAEAPAASEAGCAIETPVRLKSVASRDGKIVIHGEPLIACATARAAALHLVQTVAPVAKGATSLSLSGVTAAGFECRPRNRQPGGKLSAHGKGLALDVMSFQFSDGSTTTVAAPGERLSFITGARKAACGYFTTVLGPGSDEAHRDHLHFDIEAHGSSGYARICQ